MCMKAIQITVDEGLLTEFDQTEEVLREGRSAVIRRVLAGYLSRRRADRVKQAYERAYGQGEGLGEEFEGWEGQATWPE